jgi:hypothetical protein
METIILPIVIKNNKRVIYNEGIYIDKYELFKHELREIYNSIKGIEITFNDLISQVLNSNYSKEHYVCNLSKYNLSFVFININKMQEYQTIETTVKAILKHENI